jgi:hypothetical protein
MSSSERMLILVLLITHVIRSIRLQHHISNALILRQSAFVKVHVSQAYVAIGKIKALTKRTLVFLEIPLSAQTLESFNIEDLAIAKRLRISFVQPPSLTIREPRKLNWSAHSTSVPSTSSGWLLTSEPTFINLVLVTFRRRPSASLSTFTLLSSSFISLRLVDRRVVSSAYRRLLSKRPLKDIPPLQSSKARLIIYLHKD